MAAGGEVQSAALFGPASLTEGPSSFGEDDPEFVNEEDRLRFQCPVHKGLLHQTRQTPCGHRMCQGCVSVWLDGAASKRCPVGESDCEDISETNVYPDKSIQRELKSIPVYCKNKNEGCPAKMPYKNYRSHQDDCEFQPVSCEFSPRGCREKILRGKLREHQEQCGFRPVRCRLCHMEICHNQLQAHNDNDCEEKVVGCPFGCKNETLKRKEVTDHRDVCPVHPVDCKFAHMGCKFVGERDAVDQHVKEGMAQHLDLLTQHVAQLRQTSDATQQQLSSMSAERERLQQKVEDRQGQRTQVPDLERQVRDLKLKIVTMMEKVITVERKVPELAERPQLEALEQTVRALQQRVTQVEQQGDRSQPQGAATGGGAGGGAEGSTQVPHYRTLSNMAETVFNQLSGHDRQIQVQDVRMAEMDLRFQLLETASYDGTLIWKIKDYTQRKRDAVNGRTLSLYSQPFYSHRFGYKFCARVYLNGDGMGKTTHLSLFFVIMRGENDALMRWPFRQKVTLTLLDQSPEKRHLSDSFIPDTVSSSFQRPTSEMNVATGCPLFVSHTVLENESNGFLKQDTIFIRILVDPTPSPHGF
ncbi:TNF receptor-associated factor 3-like [Babylonia areolata]|uniref:TNF receptor-associated factor 3-like n=1 Tax=Babylonia areolata TaxID=304850 RepID=UPI003FD2E34B